MYEYELEIPYRAEAAYEGEGEWETECEGECEAEAFFARLAGLARRAIQSPALRRIGLTAARTALGGLGDIGGAIGGALGGEGANVGRQLGAQAGRYLSGLLPQREFEDEAEYEYEANPIARVYPAVLMEHLGHAAAEAETEAEAEAYIGALVPLAAQCTPRSAPVILRTAPALVRGLTGAARTLRRSPTTRPLVRTLPTILRQTATTIARQTRQGQPVTPRSAVRTLARQTARIISSPQLATRAYQRSRALDRQYHRVAGGQPQRCTHCGRPRLTTR